MQRMRWRVLATCVGLLGCVSFAGAQVTIDFETYTAGNPAAGQDGWTLSDPATTGTGIIIDTDNGPAAGGSKCIELTSPIPGQGLPAYILQKSILDQVPIGGGIVTLQYDIRWTNGQPNNSGLNVRARVYDSATGYGIMPAHWWGLDSQYYGAKDPAGTVKDYVGNLDGYSRQLGNGNPDWHTWKWVIYFGTETGATYGQCLYFELDGERVYRFDSYLPEFTYAADMLRLMLYETDNWDPPADRDIVRFDNLIVEGSPLPSQVPVPDAGPAQNVPGSSIGGVVTLDASGSTDDGSIVHYRWLNLDEADYYQRTIAHTTSPVVDVVLPNDGSYNIRLEVVDDTGLQAYDDTVVTVGSWTPPATDDIWGPFGIKHGDIYGTAQHPYVLPAGKLHMRVLNQRTGLPDPAQDRQLLFDHFGNVYFVTWDGYLKSLTPELVDRWTTEDMGCTRVQALIVGDRYVYSAAMNEDELPGVANGAPVIYAFSKSDGSMIWYADLNLATGEMWPNCEPSGWLMTLYQDKIYIVGDPQFNVDPQTEHGDRYIYQLSASDGTVEWASLLDCGGLANDWRVEGIVAFVPDAYGVGLHGMFFQERSQSEADGIADAVALQIDPTPITGGATVVWGQDAGYADRSYPTYSAVTDKVYMLNQSNWAGQSTWAFDPDTGLIARYATSGYDHPRKPATGLDFNGMTAQLAEDMGEVYSMHDGDGTGANMTMAMRTYDLNLLNPNNPEHGGYFGNRAILMQNADGDTIMLTAHEPWWYDPDGGTVEDRGPTQVVLLNLTQDDGTPTENDLDDGPIYIDDVQLTENSVPQFTETFETYPLGPLPLFPASPWEFTGDAGAPIPEVVVDPDNASNKVLMIDPFGGNSYEVSAVKANFGVSYPVDPYGVVEVTWRQKRADLTDNFWIETRPYVPDPYANSWGVFEWDGGGDSASQKAYGMGGDPDWSPTALLQVDAWEPGYLSWDYLDWVFGMKINGTNEGGVPPVFDTSKTIDSIELGMEATPPTSSGWTPTLFEPAGMCTVSTYDTTIPNDWDWGEAEALSVAPDGSIYFMQFKNWDRRYTRLKVDRLGDMNCDWAVNAYDIDGFICALSPQCDYEAMYPDCDRMLADCNGDGYVNSYDIDGFIALVGGG
ncbi:MAG: hypothetical protein ABIG44_13985 [Planctomycetota bacterium]